jgi:hypothetical protein
VVVEVAHHVTQRGNARQFIPIIESPGFGISPTLDILVFDGWHTSRKPMEALDAEDKPTQD